MGALGFCSNQEFLDELGAEAPASYEDLLNPALEDNIAMADQRTSGTAATAAANLVALLGSEEAALDYLKELDSNIFQYTRSGSAPGRMAAQGEVATAVIFSHDCVAFELETGVDLAISLDEVALADGYSPQLAEDLRGGDFPERFANEVRGGAQAPE